MEERLACYMWHPVKHLGTSTLFARTALHASQLITFMWREQWFERLKGWFVCSVEKFVEYVLLWPKFLDPEKTKLALEETFVIDEDIMRAHLTVS